ncbi:hypothetical protein GEV38_27615 [Pseudomonas sp. 13159349]|nr:hypothetical protein GEV38_27615 [Pseudomonas sp. 13159349]
MQRFSRYLHWHELKASAVPVGAGMPANQVPRCVAPALPVFAGTPAPTGTAKGPLQAVRIARPAGRPLHRQAVGRSVYSGAILHISKDFTHEAPDFLPRGAGRCCLPRFGLRPERPAVPA